MCRCIHAHFGFEYEVLNAMALRVGYVTGYDERGIQGGFGLSFNRYLLDYAYTPFSSDLGNSHRISVGINF